jgi:hypothetical protein
MFKIEYWHIATFFVFPTTIIARLLLFAIDSFICLSFLSVVVNVAFCFISAEMSALHCAK